ncbi:hypothetical protein BLNAU_18980 [Blattamonas nauphoetae]|uniref:Uncharacterized protein n=1 Tax=Blattamonas nauphoetae TaxID=2049346 RepID=A0ABQ9X308_9EUKA|nr:hypothetical protein BLNAU_18980 [Blattamonas nauphoetae]
MISEPSVVNEDHSPSALDPPPSWNPSNISSLLQALQCNEEELIVEALRELQKVASESGSDDTFDEWYRFLSPLCCGAHSSGLLAELMKLIEILYSKSPSFIRSSLSSEIPSFVITQFGDWSNCPALESCCSCMESLFFASEISESLFQQLNNIIRFAFDKIIQSSPPSAIITTLARISLFPNHRCSSNVLRTLCHLTSRDSSSIKCCPSTIFSNPSPLQQYSGLSFTYALALKLRSEFTEFNASLQHYLSEVSKTITSSTEAQNISHRPLEVCSDICLLEMFIFNTTPPNEVDIELQRTLVLFAFEAIPSIHAMHSKLDIIISDNRSSEKSPLTRILLSLVVLLERFWFILMAQCRQKSRPSGTALEPLILDHPSLPALIVMSIKLCMLLSRATVFTPLLNLSAIPSMKEKFISCDLIRTLFDTVDFLSIPLSNTETHSTLLQILVNMLSPTADDNDQRVAEYPAIRRLVFDQAKEYIRVVLPSLSRATVPSELLINPNQVPIRMHLVLREMELKSQELDADFVSDLVRWEVRWVVDTETDEDFEMVFRTMFRLAAKWKDNLPERLKRREVLLREEGWSDALEQRIVGIETSDRQLQRHLSLVFRYISSFNTDPA